MSKRVLVVAAHPDDEALGAGGTLAKHVCQGDRVTVAFLADGTTSRAQPDSIEAIESRESASKKAARVLGLQEPVFLGFADNQMDSLPLLDIIKPVESIIDEIQPHIIYTHHHGDLNIDHRITHQAVITACRPQSDSAPSTLLAFEVLSSTEWQTPNSGHAFEPNWFVDISSTIEQKRQSLNCYFDEMRESPHTRSMENLINLASLRGAQVYTHYAEAFMLIRHIV